MLEPIVTLTKSASALAVKTVKGIILMSLPALAVVAIFLCFHTHVSAYSKVTMEFGNEPAEMTAVTDQLAKASATALKPPPEPKHQKQSAVYVPSRKPKV